MELDAKATEWKQHLYGLLLITLLLVALSPFINVLPFIFNAPPTCDKFDFLNEKINLKSLKLRLVNPREVSLQLRERTRACIATAIKTADADTAAGEEIGYLITPVVIGIHVRGFAAHIVSVDTVKATLNQQHK